MLFIILIVIILINLSSSYKVQLHIHNHHQIHKHHYQLCNYHRHYEIYSSKTDDDVNAISNFNPNPNPTPSNLNRDYLIAFLIIPLLSLIIPSFLSVVVNSAESLNTRSNYIIALLVFKRLYIYLIATVSVSIAAKRSLSLPNELGKRLSFINTEMLGINIDDLYPENNTTIATSNFDNNILVNIARMEKESNNEIYESLDQMKDNTQAIVLPIIISLSLLASFAYLTGFSTANDNNVISTDIVNVIRNNINSIILLANVAVCIVFSNIEIKNALTTIFQGSSSSTSSSNDDNKNIIYSPVFSFGIALGISALAVLSGTGGGLWPLQNIINMCISITVARALQFSRLPTIILALIGLVFYDYVTVIGLQQFTDGGASIMEAVARAKIETSSTPLGSVAPSVGSAVTSLVESIRQNWQPGLFEIVINKKVSDVLGLADVVFPSILAGWALRYDNNKMVSTNISLFSSTLIGYMIGCFALEITQTGAGQPALIYLVPSMLISVLVSGIFNKKIQDMWNF